MNQVGACQPIREPLGECQGRPPLQPVRLGEDIGRNAKSPGQIQATCRRLTGQQAAGEDPVPPQRERQPQCRHLALQAGPA
jgi:hypothetical protein